MTGRSQAHQIRRRCAAAVSELAIPVPFELGALGRSLERRTSGRVQLVPADMAAGGPSGAWIRAGATSYFFYERQTSPVHKAHIVLSLAGRLLLSREPGPSADHRLTPNIGGQLSRLMLGSAAGAAASDAEAETFAMIAAERADLTRLALPATMRFLGDLRPLRSVLCAAVPEAGSHALWPRWPRRDLSVYRHVIEIRDCLLALRPFRDDQVATRALQRARADGLADAELAAAVEAAVLGAAVHARISGRQPERPAASGAGHIGPSGPDLYGDADWLASVWRALAASARTSGLVMSETTRPGVQAPDRYGRALGATPLSLSDVIRRS